MVFVLQTCACWTCACSILLDLYLLNVTLMASMLDLCYLWYSWYVPWDICAIMRYLLWMCLIYAILTVGMYICYICDGCGYYIISRQYKKNSKLCRVFLTLHSAKQPFFYLLENRFAECNYLATRWSLKLRRVPDAWHSAKIQTSPSATRLPSA